MLLAIDWGQGIEDAWSDLAAFLPKLIAAIVVLLVGWFIARVIRKVVERVLKKINFDRYMDKSGLGAPIERAGWADSGHLLALLIYYALMLVVIQLAIGVFGDTAVNEAFDGLIAFIPKLFIAIIIIIITGVVANAVRSMVSASVSHLDAGPLIAKGAFVAIWVIGAFAAIDQIEFAQDVVDTLWQTLAYSLGLIAVIKFGVGGVWAARDRFWPAVYDQIGGVQSASDDAAPSGGSTPGGDTTAPDSIT